MSPRRSWPESAWIMGMVAEEGPPAPGVPGGGRAPTARYDFFTSGHFCASTEGNASAGEIVFTIW